jgi:hypothetical protein
MVPVNRGATEAPKPKHQIPNNVQNSNNQMLKTASRDHDFWSFGFW